MWLSTLRRRSNLKYGFWIDSFEILDVDNHDNEQSSLPSLYADPYQTYTNDKEQTDGCGKKDKPSVKNKHCVLLLLVRDPGFHLFLFVTL